MTQVLITGGTGFIGRALTKRLVVGYDVFPFGRREYDLTDRDETRRLFQLGTYKYIIHLADVVPDWSGVHAYEQYLQQLAMTQNVLEWWRVLQPQARLVTMGSLWSYPAACTVCSEDQFWNGPLHPLTASYGHGKKLMTIGIETLKRQYGMKGTTLVLGSVYGPGDQSQHVIPSLIRRMKENPKQLDIQTDGQEIRHFTYIDDQVERIIQHLDYDGELLNIPNPGACTVRMVVEVLRQLLPYSGGIHWGGSARLPSRWLTATRSATVGYISLREGLRRTLNALVSQ